MIVVYCFILLYRLHINILRYEVFTLRNVRLEGKCGRRTNAVNATNAGGVRLCIKKINQSE